MAVPDVDLCDALAGTLQWVREHQMTPGPPADAPGERCPCNSCEARRRVDEVLHEYRRWKEGNENCGASRADELHDAVRRATKWDRLMGLVERDLAVIMISAEEDAGWLMVDHENVSRAKRPLQAGDVVKADDPRDIGGQL